jgi:hypothetical protein
MTVAFLVFCLRLLETNARRPGRRAAVRGPPLQLRPVSVRRRQNARAIRHVSLSGLTQLARVPCGPDADYCHGVPAASRRYVARQQGDGQMLTGRRHRERWREAPTFVPAAG